jgi:hypothetical protein
MTCPRVIISTPRSTLPLGVLCRELDRNDKPKMCAELPCRTSAGSSAPSDFWGAGYLEFIFCDHPFGFALPISERQAGPSGPTAEGRVSLESDVYLVSLSADFHPLE